jgi:hypothetical protein
MGCFDVQAMPHVLRNHIEGVMVSGNTGRTRYQTMTIKTKQTKNNKQKHKNTNTETILITAGLASFVLNN